MAMIGFRSNEMIILFNHGVFHRTQTYKNKIK